MIKGCIIGRCAHDETLVAEHVTDDIRMVSLRHVIHHYILHARLGGSTGDDLGSTLRIAIHRTIADDQSGLCLILGHTVILSHHLINILVPDGAVRSTNIVKLHAGQLLECVLHGRAVLTHNVRVVAHHLKPEGITVDLLVNHTAIERAEAAKGIAREQR